MHQPEVSLGGSADKLLESTSRKAPEIIIYQTEWSKFESATPRLGNSVRGGRNRSPCTQKPDPALCHTKQRMLRI